MIHTVHDEGQNIALATRPSTYGPIYLSVAILVAQMSMQHPTRIDVLINRLGSVYSMAQLPTCEAQRMSGLLPESQTFVPTL